MASIDLRQHATLTIHAEQGVIYAPSFDGIETLDAGYTLMLDEGEATEVSWTVGSGLTLQNNPNSIVWALDTSSMLAKTYEGYLISDSRVAGVYLKIEIKLILE